MFGSISSFFNIDAFYDPVFIIIAVVAIWLSFILTKEKYYSEKFENLRESLKPMPPIVSFYFIKILFLAGAAVLFWAVFLE